MQANGYLAASALMIAPVGEPLTGRVTPPGSKSITNRALLLAALATGHSHITGALKSIDTSSWQRRCAQMGVTVEEPDATSFIVDSSGHLRAPASRFSSAMPAPRCAS